MDPFEVIALVAVTFIVVGIPLTGLVIRFALQPMLRDMSSAIRGNRDEPGALAEIARRLEAIEGRLDEQDARVREALETNRFYGELEAGKGGRAEATHQEDRNEPR